MKKNNSQNDDVLVLDAEEIPLEEVINKSLIKANVTDAVIDSLKEKYGNLRLASIDDKESYLEIKEARKEVRKVGILTEKLCKKGREDAIAIQRKWLTKEKEILGKIAEVENPLNDEIEKFDNEVERKELEAAKKREEIYINRQSALSKIGAVYDNGSFVLNHISYEIELIKQADEDMWNDTILPKYKKVYEENEAARVTEENKRKAEQEELKRQREEFEAQQKAFKEQQELFQNQQAQLNQQKEESDRRQRLEQEHKDREAREKREEVVNKRIEQLISLGMTYSPQYSAYLYKDVNIDVMTELKLWDEQEWNDVIAKITPVIAERKKEEEEKQAAKIAEDIRLAKEQAAQAERERIAEEQRLAEIKRQQEEKRKAEELALSGDKSMYADVISYLSNYPRHAMKSNIYKGKMNAIANFIENL